jgi:hypothetical protein
LDTVRTLCAIESHQCGQLVPSIFASSKILIKRLYPDMTLQIV